MLASGAEDFVSLPFQETIAELGLKVVQAQACHEGRYWNTTGAGRQAIVQGALVVEMQKRGLSIMSHGAARRRGNDQVRFQIIATMLDPRHPGLRAWRHVGIPAALRRPAAEWSDYCEQYGIQSGVRAASPTSTDANLLVSSLTRADCSRHCKRARRAW